MRKNIRELVAWIKENLSPYYILEIGSFQVEGQEGFADLRPFFPKSLYVGLDLRPGPGVNLLGDAHALPFKNSSMELIFCVDTLEHVLDPWKAIKEMKRVLHPEGLLVLSSVMRFPIHDHPWDFWRFTPEIFKKFGEHIGKYIVLYQGEALEPDTVILLASPAGALPEKIPPYLDGRPLVRYGEEHRCAERIFTSPYLPRFAPMKYLLSPEHSWGLAMELVPEGAEVLDVGCGPGFVGAALARFKRCRVWGVELNPAAASQARIVYENVAVVDLESAELSACFPEKRFDVVLFLDVLEHLRDPEKILREARKILKPEGFLVVSLPNVTHASLVGELLRGRFDYRLWGLLDETHLRFFSREGLVRLLEAAGYRVETIKRVIRPPEATEFGPSSWNDLPPEVRDFIRRNNPEYLTYQFVVRAVPLSRPASRKKKEAASPPEDLHSLLLRRIRDLENRLETLVRECSERDRIVRDLLSSRSWRITAPLRKISTMIRKLKAGICSR